MLWEGEFCDRVSLVFEKYRVLRGPPFDRVAERGGFVLRRFSATVAYEGLNEVKHY